LAGAAILSEGSAEKGSTSKLTPLALGTVQFLPGCWMKVLVLCWLVASDCSQCFTMWASPLGHSQHSSWLLSKWASEAMRGDLPVRSRYLCNSILEAASHPFCHFLFIRSQSLYPAPLQGKDHKSGWI
jgi:hypothetical protein